MIFTCPFMQVAGLESAEGRQAAAEIGLPPLQTLPQILRSDAHDASPDIVVLDRIQVRHVPTSAQDQGTQAPSSPHQSCICFFERACHVLRRPLHAKKLTVRHGACG